MNVSAGAKVLEAALAEKKAFVLDRLANYRKASHFTFRKNRALRQRLAALYFSLSVFLGIHASLLLAYLSWRLSWPFLAIFLP